MSHGATIAALCVVAAVASAFDAIAGGGGLVTLPALLLAGFDPVAALATNKVQSSAGAVSACAVYLRRRLVLWPLGWIVLGCAAIAAACGAGAVSILPRGALAGIVPLVLIVVGIAFAALGKPSAADRAPRMPPSAFALAIVSALGFYDGIFGPGTGSFLTAGFVVLLGFGLLKATAHAKLANAASNIGALAVFSCGGRVDWSVGLAMAAGSILGGQVGSRVAVRHGAVLIRPMLVAVSLLMAARLLADPGNPLGHWLVTLLARSHGTPP